MKRFRSLYFYWCILCYELLSRIATREMTYCTTQSMRTDRRTDGQSFCLMETIRGNNYAKLQAILQFRFNYVYYETRRDETYDSVWCSAVQCSAVQCGCWSSLMPIPMPMPALPSSVQGHSRSSHSFLQYRFSKVPWRTWRCSIWIQIARTWQQWKYQLLLRKIYLIKGNGIK